MRAAIFDLDGTLADTSQDLIAAANACFDRPLLDPAADRKLAFRGGKVMLRAGLERLGMPDEDEVERRYPILLAHYAENLDRHTRLYDGVERALDALAAAGWRLGVCTNKPHDMAEELLTRLAIRPRFAAMLGAGALPVRKPDPTHLLETITRSGGQRDRAVLIGDTETDRAAARNAAVPCVLVSFGPEGREVSALTPEALLDHYDDLPALLDRLMPDL